MQARCRLTCAPAQHPQCPTWLGQADARQLSTRAPPAHMRASSAPSCPARLPFVAVRRADLHQGGLQPAQSPHGNANQGTGGHPWSPTHPPRFWESGVEMGNQISSGPASPLRHLPPADPPEQLRLQVQHLHPAHTSGPWLSTPVDCPLTAPWSVDCHLILAQHPSGPLARHISAPAARLPRCAGAGRLHACFPGRYGSKP